MNKQSKKTWISPKIEESVIKTTTGGLGTVNSETPTYGLGDIIS
jgi:hypothetical protein